jgi:hypothetical protein
MKQSILLGLATVLCFAPLLGARANDSAKANPTTMTCEDVLALDEEVQPEFVGWIAGYNSKGKLVSEDLVEDDVVVPDAAVVLETCRKNPTAKAKDAINGAKKPAA